MATEPTPGAAPAVTPASTPVPGGPPTPPEPLAGDGQLEQISLDEAKKLRKEAQALRARLNGYEAQEKAAQEAALSEVEKSNKRATDAEAKIQSMQKQLVTAQVKMAAQAKNIIDPDMAAFALNELKMLEYGDDGLPTNLDKALDELIKAKPYLVPKSDAQPASPAQTNATPQLPAMNPGRSSIQAPTGNIPGVRRRLSEFL